MYISLAHGASSFITVRLSSSTRFYYILTHQIIIFFVAFPSLSLLVLFNLATVFNFYMPPPKSEPATIEWWRWNTCSHRHPLLGSGCHEFLPSSLRFPSTASLDSEANSNLSWFYLQPSFSFASQKGFGGITVGCKSWSL